MTRAIVIAVLLLGLALGLGRILGARELPLDTRVERLVDPPQGEGASVAAISIRGGGYGELFYARSKGLWRSREGFGAVCREPAVEALLSACLQARGETLSRDPARAARYGLSEDQRVVLRFHGSKVLERADEHVLFGFELGHSVSEGSLGRAFARALGTQSILEIDRDPRRALARPGAELPPLVDARLCAGAFVPGLLGFRRFALDYSSGRSFALESEAPAQAGADPEWSLQQEGRRERAIAWRAGGFTGVWIRAQALGFERTQDAALHGLDKPFLKLVLTPSSGEPVELWLSELHPSHVGWLWNKRTNVLMRIDADLWKDIAAEPAEFLDAARPNPWERWLVR